MLEVEDPLRARRAGRRGQEERAFPLMPQFGIEAEGRTAGSRAPIREKRKKGNRPAPLRSRESRPTTMRKETGRWRARKREAPSAAFHGLAPHCAGSVSERLRGFRRRRRCVVARGGPACRRAVDAAETETAAMNRRSVVEYPQAAFARVGHRRAVRAKEAHRATEICARGANDEPADAGRSRRTAPLESVPRSSPPKRARAAGVEGCGSGPKGRTECREVRRGGGNGRRATQLERQQQVEEARISSR